MFGFWFMARKAKQGNVEAGSDTNTFIEPDGRALDVDKDENEPELGGQRDGPLEPVIGVERHDIRPSLASECGVKKPWCHG